MTVSNQSTPLVTFSGWRLAQLSSFRIGSAMVEILATSVWNRVMITHLGMPASAVGFLLALRYFLAPLSVWAGHRSDTIPLFGMYRTSYILVGRFITVGCLPFLGLSVAQIEGGSPGLGWALAVISFIFYAIGSLLTGSPYLALVRDSAPKERQGLSISVTETAFIIFIAASAIAFARWMESYSAEVFWQMIFICMGFGAFFWSFGIWGVEKNSISPDIRLELIPDDVKRSNALDTFRKIWADGRTRLFFVFLSLSTLAAWSQDTILEPFGGEVLGLSMGATTRFTSYWQSATVVTLVLGAVIWRNRPPHRQSGITFWGLIGMGVGMSLIAADAFLVNGQIVLIGLVVFGAGFGIYTFGALSLMAVMATDEDAGAYLGLWTISILVFKGLGTFLGGAIRDITILSIGTSASLGYGIAFGFAAVALFISAILITRLDVVGFVRDVGRINVDLTDAEFATADV